MLEEDEEAYYAGISRFRGLRTQAEMIGRRKLDRMRESLKDISYEEQLQFEDENQFEAEDA